MGREARVRLNRNRNLRWWVPQWRIGRVVILFAAFPLFVCMGICEGIGLWLAEAREPENWR